MKLSVLALALVAACSGGAKTFQPDARELSDASPDAAPDAMLPDALTAPGCDFVQRDHTSIPDGEDLPFLYTGTPITICGSLDLLHGTQAWVQPYGTYTTFVLRIDQKRDAVVSFHADAPIDVWQGGVAYYTYTGEGPFATSTTDSHFLATFGQYGNSEQLTVTAAYPTTATAPISYKLTIEPYDYKPLCPALTTPADYTEAHDGQFSTGNDVASYAGTATLHLTSDPSDSPELTGLTINPGDARRIHGVSEAVPQSNDEANDRDTYQFTTGPSTTYVIVRPTPYADAQAFILFYLMTPDLQHLRASGSGHNGLLLPGGLGIFPVEPSTTYWLQVLGSSETGGHDGLPLTYDVSLCGANAAP